MNETELQFRTATFGGFQKQDVLAYLETSARDHAEKLSALQRELDESRQAREGAEEQAAGREAKLTALEEENRRLAADLASRTEALARESAQRAEFAAQVEALSGEIRKITPAAEAYTGLKDRTAGIELEAHSRAQAIEAEAKAKVKQTKAELENWIDQLQKTYDGLRTDLNASVEQVSGELEQAARELRSRPAELAARDAELRALREGLEKLTGPKAPQPLPLERK
ncbi:MAG: hypothetical protein VB096_02145 [Pseudoflavonifractor sp.]|nr:hypothetical protein [Pseudoflavonifractor sp.]